MLEGLHPNRPTHVFRITTDERSARAMTDLIGEIFDPAETAVASFETEDGGPWLLEAYFASQPDEAAIRDLLRPIVGAEADKGVFLPLDQKDWVKASLEGLKPVRAGRILVHGSHDRDQRRPNDIAIEIEAGLAFGTGHHGTTKGCLLAFVDELKMRTPRHVLDVGTGTGILAFAAAKILKRPVVAGDIDPEAVRVARENARLNGIAPWMRLYVGPGIRHADGRPSGPFRPGLRQYPGQAPAGAGAVAGAGGEPATGRSFCRAFWPATSPVCSRPMRHQGWLPAAPLRPRGLGGAGFDAGQRSSAPPHLRLLTRTECPDSAWRVRDGAGGFRSRLRGRPSWR